jgi:hypothetical protein
MFLEDAVVSTFGETLTDSIDLGGNTRGPWRETMFWSESKDGTIFLVRFDLVIMGRGEEYREQAMEIGEAC